MALLELAGKQAIILRSYAAFGSRDDLERCRGMRAMYECGTAAQWCLQIAIRQNSQPRVQFAAAVVLHWRGERKGLITLTEALKWRLPAEPLLAAPLESAFILIGSPDAVSALLTLWNMLPDWGEHESVRASISRVWAALRNPVVLPTLAAGALLSPSRFEQTVPAFGELAIPILREMAQSQDIRRRALAVRTLRHVPGPSAFTTLVPLLQERDPDLRALVPAALEQTGYLDALVIEISNAVRNGYPSIDAVSVLSRARPDDLSDTLTIMFETWSPARGNAIDSEIVLMALPTLMANAADTRRALCALCGVLDKPNDPQVSVALMNAIESFARSSRAPEPAVMLCLAEQLNVPNTCVREQAAAALARLGNAFPSRVIDFLDDCKPQDTFFSQLQVILHGGRDAGQAATQAVQHVSMWWTRLTSESVDQRRGGLSLLQTAENSAKYDPGLPAMICRMLASVLLRSHTDMTSQDVEEKASFIVLLLRGLSHLGMPDANSAWREIVSVLHLPAAAFASVGRSSDMKCYETTAAAAAETLLALYGPDSFGLFLEALYSPRMEVVRTGITAMGMLGDSRGLQPLRSIAANERHPCSAMAAQAIAQIRRTNPEMMSLLRGSSPAVSDPGMLLRAARGNSQANAADLLLRATTNQADRRQNGST